jgi:2-dehydro-3-deoxyphosphogluconate aldolase/(4S)-4-hydroxy-2-oxoglutarate aldolase
MEMDVFKSIESAGIVPVVVMENAADAVQTADALTAGGVRVMEITFRTDAAADAIRAVSEGCPEMLVGAGTVVTPEQCRRAVQSGAKFIVSPGFDAKIVEWCLENGVAVTPGCVTPTEIMAALSMGLHVLKFFPAGVYGGLDAMKALSAPFGGVRFIPTGGVSAQNVGEYIAAPCVFAVGGSWICSKADISAGRFDRITTLTREARAAALGFEFAHLGINCEDEQRADSVCGAFSEAFGFPVKAGNSSNFSTPSIEVMKSVYLGEKGHIAVRTNSILCALGELQSRGFEADMQPAKYKNGRMIAVYLKRELGGFAVHLLQR